MFIRMRKALYKSVAEVAAIDPNPDVVPRLFHVINPFCPKPGSEHENAQRVTYECIRQARLCSGSDSVEVVCVVFPEDASVVPKDFTCSAVLSRSIMDLMESPRALPLLFDILATPLPGGEARHDDYIIYTNIDIAPMPSFYRFVCEVACRGFDAFAINRRTVDMRTGGGVDFGMMQCEIGEKHPGTDCVVFRRELLEKFVKSDCCIGVSAVMKSLLYNIAAFSPNMVIFRDAHATFHLGDDRQWSNPTFQPLSDHNKSEANRIANHLSSRGGATREKLQWFATERRERGLLRVLGLDPPSRASQNEISHEEGSNCKRKRKTAGPRTSASTSVLKGSFLIFKKLLKKIFGKTGEKFYGGNDELNRNLAASHRVHSEGARQMREANTELLKSSRRDARLFSYLMEPIPLVLNADLREGRSAPVFDFGIESYHPFVIAARVAVASPESRRRSLIKEVLDNYYQMIRPATFCDLAGIDGLSEEVGGLPSYAYVFPWERNSPSEKVLRMSVFVEKENSSRGLDEGKESGWTWVGPVSVGKLDVEVTRLADLLSSILTRGYQRSDAKDGDIRGLILMRTPQDWVWLATGGQHRACVLSALGNRTCPLRVRGVVRRDDVSAWPNVVRGVYTEEQALTIFDRIFSGDYGHLDEDWRKQVAEKGWI